MITIRYAEPEDRAFWFTLDAHLPDDGYAQKLRDKQAYVMLEDGQPIGILRYNLFWDSIPFCTMLFLEWARQRKGFGRQLMTHWEEDMKKRGYDMVMVSTQVDEGAQHFYRKLGYQDCGGLVMTIPGHEQPMEMFLDKALQDYPEGD